MNADEREIARKIVRQLDRSARSVDGEAAARLSAAREQALSQFQHTPIAGLAGAGHLASHLLERPMSAARYALPLAVLILGLAGIVFWQSGSGSGGELADIDARLLTDDLPIDAYLDKGFDSWLSRQPR